MRRYGHQAPAAPSLKGSKSAPQAYTIGTTPQRVLAANGDRLSATLWNTGAQTIFLGSDNTVSPTNGVPLAANAALVDDDSYDEWWAVVASGTSTMPVVEVST